MSRLCWAALGSCLSVDVETHNNAELYATCDVFGLLVGLWKRARQDNVTEEKKRETQDRRWSREGQNKTDSLSRVPSLLQCCRVCVLGLRLRLLWFVLALVSVAMGTLKSRTSLSSLVVEEAVSMQH